MPIVPRFLQRLVMVLAVVSPVTTGAQKAHVPKRSMAIHGPFMVSASELGSTGTNDPAATSIPQPPRDVNDPRTPPASRGFDATNRLGGIDPGIAAGKTFLLVSDDAGGVAVYRKDGSLVAKGQFPLVITPAKLFAKAAADASTQLNYPASLPTAWKVGINAYGDVRVQYDHFRGRFWIYAMGKGPRPVSADSIRDFPSLKLQRRNKAMVAVSKSEDPRDGFYTYWWDEGVKDGTCNQPAGCGDADFGISGEGADYPSIGITPKYLTVAIAMNRRDPAFNTSTTAKAQEWIDCKTSFVSRGTTFNWCGPFYSNLQLVDARVLADGCTTAPAVNGTCPKGRTFSLFIDAGNWVTDRTEGGAPDFATGMSRGVRPVTMYGMHIRLSATPPMAEAFFVTSYIDRTKSTPMSYLVLWTYMNDELTPTRYKIAPFTYESRDAWRYPLSAVYRDGKVYSTFIDCWPGESGCLKSIRLSRINLDKQAVDIDRRFGLRSSDDPAGSKFNYHYPAVTVTSDNDVVVSYARFDNTQAVRSQEVRFSVWYAGEKDVRPSRQLRQGEYVGTDGAFNTDIGGIALDPSGKSAWVAHQYAGGTGSAPARRIAVGEVNPRRTLRLNPNVIGDGGALPRKP